MSPGLCVTVAYLGLDESSLTDCILQLARVHTFTNGAAASQKHLSTLYMVHLAAIYKCCWIVLNEIVVVYLVH